jgi:hypothetical protein
MVVVGEGVKEDFGLWMLDFGFGTGMSAEYDPNGNFIALTRQGPSGTGDSFISAVNFRRHALSEMSKPAFRHTP